MILGKDCLYLVPKKIKAVRYHLQTVPIETYVLNYVLTSTIGKIQGKEGIKNRTPKSAEKRENTRKTEKNKEKGRS